jgi:hypothetical protein
MNGPPNKQMRLEVETEEYQSHLYIVSISFVVFFLCFFRFRTASCDKKNR